MRTIWLLIKAITAIALIFAGAVFALRNDQLLNVDFILFQSVNISLGLWLFNISSTGGIFGYVGQ